VCRTFWWGNLKEREHFENLDVDGRKILKYVVIVIIISV
jgi:hypothetical protein